MEPVATREEHAVNPANRFGWDYRAKARELGPPVVPIVDVHTHVAGDRAAEIFRDAMDLYGVERVWSMSPLEQLPRLKEILGERIDFIAVPNYWADGDRKWHMGEGYVERIREYHRAGARVAKFWAAPRARDYEKEIGQPGFLRLDSPARRKAMETAAELGMMFMTHVADPDTWFRSRYADASVYGTKAAQYEPFERLLDEFSLPWIAAHMGGWPEDLAFLDGLLERHDNLHLDASATKWMVRELSTHPRDEFVAFFARWRGRIFFGSDIVTTDDHLVPARGEDATEMQRKAGSEDEAFDLYASRYWALRTLYETTYDGESPIADPDLAMTKPDRHGPMDAPPLRGKALPDDLRRDLYRNAIESLVKGA